MLHAALIFIGGGLGALGRWGFGLLAAKTFGAAWPWGTLGVNILGSLLMGFVIGSLGRLDVPSGQADTWRLFLATGILGGFTTFSAFSLETARMLEGGQWGSAGLYTSASVGLSVAALFAGMALSRLNV